MVYMYVLVYACFVKNPSDIILVNNSSSLDGSVTIRF
jgi:hypothetical protein